MKNKKRKSNLVWLDLEMTGLNPDKDRIIEIATVVTDHKLNLMAAGPNLVIHQPWRVLNAMDSWNKRQHGKSGLTAAVKHSRISIKMAEHETLRFLRRYCHAKRSPLCGNVIHHDRQFLIRHMPRLHRFLDYHHVDVSTLKRLMDDWFPRDKAFKKKKRHRALGDILESIEELRLYRNICLHGVKGRRRSMSFIAPLGVASPPLAPGPKPRASTAASPRLKAVALAAVK